MAVAFVLERHRNLIADRGNPSVAFFGAGKFARGLIALLHQSGQPLPEVIIDEAEGQRPLRGIPVIGVAAAKAAGWNQPGRKIIVVINQKKLASAIEANLAAAGFNATCLIPPDLCPLPGWEENSLVAEPQAESEFLIFHHVAKCGGTSFASLLRNYFGNNYTEVNSTADWRTCEQFVRSRPHAPRICVAGHYALGIHELAPGRRARYVTLLRHPWARFVSAINFRIGYGGHVDSIEIPHNDLIANFSVSRSLAEAKSVLDQWFESVGVLERYDESIQLFAQQLQLPMRLEHNNKSRDWRTQMLAELRPRFESKNHDDIAFYDYARARFDRAFQASPPLSNREDDSTVSSVVVFQPEPDALADEMKLARTSGRSDDLVRAHEAFFSRLPYGEIPCGIATEYCRLRRAAGRPDLAVFWHHGARQMSIRSAEYALSLAALDPFTVAALSLHIELVRLRHLGETSLAVTVSRTRKHWQAELRRHLLRAHLWHKLQDAGLADAPVIVSKLDEAYSDALRDVASRLGFADRLQSPDVNGAAHGQNHEGGAVTLVHAPVTGPVPELVVGQRTIVLPPLAEPDWPYFAEFSRLE